MTGSRFTSEARYNTNTKKQSDYFLIDCMVNTSVTVCRPRAASAATSRPTSAPRR